MRHFLFFILVCTWIFAACDDSSTSDSNDTNDTTQPDIDMVDPDSGDLPHDGDSSTDPDGQDALDQEDSLELPTEPIAPVAVAGADRLVELGSTVALNGSASSDANGDSLSYLWTVTSGTASLNDSTSARPSFDATTLGTIDIQLVVNDGALSSSPDSLTVTVVNADVDATAPVEITVLDNVVHSDVEPIGANLTKLSGGTNFAVNNHVRGSGFEPMVMRRLERIDRTGSDSAGVWLEWDGDGGIHFWDTNATGFGNGATIRFYRIVDASGAALPFSGGFTDSGNADHLIFLGEAQVPMPNTALPNGGWIAEGSEGNNRVYVDDPALELAYGDYAFIFIKKDFMPLEEAHERLHGWFNQDEYGLFLNGGDNATSRLVPHPTPIPAAFDEPGETCLRIEATDNASYNAGQWVYHPYDDAEGQWYSQLHPGSSYRVEAWLRQDGLGNNGQVNFAFVGNQAYASVNQSTPWQVTNEWQHFTYDFVAPEYPTSGMHIGHALQFTGPGTLYVDNFLLYRYDEKHQFEPFGPHENTFDEFMNSIAEAGRKPAVRFYPLQYSNSTIDALLSNYGNASLDINSGAFGGFSNATIAQSIRWAFATGQSPQDRVVPYLTISEEYTEAEWKALVEYLGVPYDANSDTPESKPYAYMRTQQRGGVGTPWTTEFREILIEYGNETWHNGAGGYGWHGFSAPGAVHQGGVEYGIFARYMIDEQVKAMPAWTQHNLDSSIKFVLGANYNADPNSGYGELAAQQGGGVAYVGHANYVGPKWETGDTGSSVFDDHGVQETLLGGYTNMFDLIEAAAASRDQLNAAGANYQLIAYEGGPSGYWTNDDNPEIDELYGKSLAMGVAALDTWLYSTLNGYGHQCYLGFSSGRWWTSHTPPEAGALRPHIGWLGLKLRNRFAPGEEMLETSIERLPRLQRGEEAVPLFSSYALRSGNQVYVFVLSRVLDGNHDGVDFGAGVVPVTLHLPFLERPSSIMLHKLANIDGSPADPRANNREAMTIDIVSSELDIAHYSNDFVINEQSGGLTGGMAPGTAYLYVFTF